MSKLKLLSSFSGVGLLLGVCLVFFAVTNPRNVPSVLLILAFGLLFMLIFACLRLLLGVVERRASLPAGRRLALLWFGSSLPILLLVLQSVGQLTVRDLLTVLALFVVGCLYAARFGGTR